MRGWFPEISWNYKSNAVIGWVCLGVAFGGLIVDSIGMMIGGILLSFMIKIEDYIDGRNND